VCAGIGKGIKTTQPQLKLTAYHPKAANEVKKSNQRSAVTYSQKPKTWLCWLPELNQKKEPEKKKEEKAVRGELTPLVIDKIGENSQA